MQCVIIVKMDARRTKLEALREHAWFGRGCAKLTKTEWDTCVNFVRDNHALSQVDFERAVNRMFLDAPVKPKNFTIILDLLTACNTR